MVVVVVVREGVKEQRHIKLGGQGTRCRFLLAPWYKMLSSLARSLAHQGHEWMDGILTSYPVPKTPKPIVSRCVLSSAPPCCGPDVYPEALGRAFLPPPAGPPGRHAIFQ